MKVLLLDAFHTGSHAQWSRGWQAHSRHEIELLTLPGRHWKWRMFGAAPELAHQFRAGNFQPDVLVATDMLDLSTFLGLTGLRVPTVLYCHENQISYPWSPRDGQVQHERNRQYGFINFTSCLAATEVWFNSTYHRHSFLSALPDFLRAFPDFNLLESVEEIRAKSKVRYLGLDLEGLSSSKSMAAQEAPVILWNHRHEYDKNPDQFFDDLIWLKSLGIAFQLVVLGARFGKSPPAFERARRELADRVLFWGYAESRDAYRQWLRRSDLLYVTARQDFFGGSTVEAIAAGCVPLLPDRLAYPEHIPETLHHEYLYADSETDREKLRRMVQNIGAYRKEALSQNVFRYSWKRISPRYDQSLENLT